MDDLIIFQHEKHKSSDREIRANDVEALTGDRGNRGKKEQKNLENQKIKKIVCVIND